MRHAAGLRTEIILNIVLLLAGALLFAAFLLVKLTERELVAQRAGSVVAATELVARSIVDGTGGDLGLGKGHGEIGIVVAVNSRTPVVEG